jgi:D-galactonate transporter
MQAAVASERGISQASNIEKVFRKVSWRLIPFLLLCYVLSYLDRVNVGFAKLEMLSDLKMSDAVYGLGAGIFFLGYFIFEVPSNILITRVGARRWIARIMISWGILSALMMFVKNEYAFYAVRFLLGMAEAGFFPGIIYYLTKWYPADRRGRATSLFLTAIALAGVIGGPVSGWILHGMGGVAGLAGWQWLFVFEGLPSVLVGFWVLAYLDNEVSDAKWLSEEEKALILSLLSAEDATKTHSRIGSALASGRTWLFAAIYFLLVFALYGISFWLPTIIKAVGVKDALQIGILSAIPWAAGCIAMILVARSSDRSGERRWHVALPTLLGAIGFIISVQFSQNIALSMLGLSIATMGIMAALPVFWSMPTAYLGGMGAAAGIALINSFGNLSGFLGPTLIGMMKTATNSLNGSVYLLALCLLLGAVLTLLSPRPR